MWRRMTRWMSLDSSKPKRMPPSFKSLLSRVYKFRLLKSEGQTKHAQWCWSHYQRYNQECLYPTSNVEARQEINVGKSKIHTKVLKDNQDQFNALVHKDQFSNYGWFEHTHLNRVVLHLSNFEMPYRGVLEVAHILIPFSDTNV